MAESLPFPKSHCQNNALFLTHFFSSLQNCFQKSNIPELQTSPTLHCVILANFLNSSRFSFSICEMERMIESTSDYRQHVKLYRILHDISIKLMSVAIVISLYQEYSCNIAAVSPDRPWFLRQKEREGQVVKTLCLRHENEDLP